MKQSLLFFVLLPVLLPILTACGSLSTLPRSDEKIANDLADKKTYCNSVSRAYSGLSYDFCTLNAQPATEYYLPQLLLLVGVDMCASTVIDTLALPYTLPAQIKKGSIELSAN